AQAEEDVRHRAPAELRPGPPVPVRPGVVDPAPDAERPRLAAVGVHVDPELDARRVERERPTPGAPIVDGPRVVGRVPVDPVEVLELHRPEVEHPRPVDVAVPVVVAEYRTPELDVAKDAPRLGPVVAAAEVHVHDAGSGQ